MECEFHIKSKRFRIPKSETFQFIECTGKEFSNGIARAFLSRRFGCSVCSSTEQASQPCSRRNQRPGSPNYGFSVNSLRALAELRVSILQLEGQLMAMRAEVRRQESARAADKSSAAAAAAAAEGALSMAAAELDELRTHMGVEISWAQDQALGLGPFHGVTLRALKPITSIIS